MRRVWAFAVILALAVACTGRGPPTPVLPDESPTAESPGFESPPGEGPELVKVPRVIGKKLGPARQTLRRAGLKVSVRKEWSSKPRGTVVSQQPAARSEVRAGRTVRLVVSKGLAIRRGDGGDNCTPGYSPCLPPASDYDCYGGSGDGPYYTAPGVTYRVTGADPYGLDADNDGYGCE